LIFTYLFIYLLTYLLTAQNIVDRRYLQ